MCTLDRWKLERGAVLWRMGPLKRWVEGGFAQTSVEGLAAMTNPVFRFAAGGTGWVEFVNLRSDMLFVFGFLGLIGGYPGMVLGFYRAGLINGDGTARRDAGPLEYYSQFKLFMNLSRGSFGDCLRGICLGPTNPLHT